MVLRAPILLLPVSLVLAVTLAAAGGKDSVPDWHLVDTAGPLLSRSDIAHGYMHGYEEGYHWGDQLFHLGGRRPDPEREYERVRKGEFPSNVRNKKRFRNGHQLGFAAGYLDGYLGREFRALHLLRQLAASPLPQTGDQFDQGFFAGYNAALAVGRTGKQPASCEALSQKQAEAEPDYCAGFARGMQLGASDARTLAEVKVASAGRN